MLQEQMISIHKLSEHTGLTSRTLRYWESEGLFSSQRDASSGWRVYDETAVLRIQITAQLRKLDISLRDISVFFTDMTEARLSGIIEQKIQSLKLKREEIIQYEKQLRHLLESLHMKPQNWITSIFEYSNDTEEIEMHSAKGKSSIKVIYLAPVRAAFYTAVSVSPEEEAMRPVLEWARSSGLLGTARLFGGNVKPMPSEHGKPYGYGMMATIPPHTGIPDPLQEMQLEGGYYAVLESSEDIGASWATLMDNIKDSNQYTSDSSRLCLEEHVRNDRPEGSGNEYHIHLLEPVKRI